MAPKINRLATDEHLASRVLDFVSLAPLIPKAIALPGTYRFLHKDDDRMREHHAATAHFVRGLVKAGLRDFMLELLTFVKTPVI